ncbi:MAG: hypothetical protein M5U12_23825 [Verrucomicrobia bacterium]|nr:hypothetical protein [Verrucomicrobiota bacterium]
MRGRLIRELAGQRLSCACEWDTIHDRAGRFLDLSDPLRDEPPTWQPPCLERRSRGDETQLEVRAS